MLTADVAQAYFAWRALDAVRGVLDRTMESRRAAIAVLRARFDAGLAAVPTSDLRLAPRYLDSQVRWQSKDKKWTSLVFGVDPSSGGA